MDARSACIWACLDCVRACIAAAESFSDAAEASPLGRASWLGRNCADLCAATGRMLAGGAEQDIRRMRAVLDACGSACRMARVACEPQAKRHQPLRIFVHACRRCEAACDRLSRIL